jgi:inosine-uridine nucleoside N-ribohydrolase
MPMKKLHLIALAWLVGASLASAEDQPPAVGAEKPLVYIDTDMANEIDDPYAVYRALIAPEFEVVAVSSVGWRGPESFEANTRTSQKMTEELLALLGLDGRLPHPIGAMHPMTGPETPVDSPAARDIIAKAKAAPEGRKLQVFVLGAYTNVASALLLDPTIKDRLTVHVMGFVYEDGRLLPREFNTHGDPRAAIYLLNCGVELNVMPNSTTGEFRWSKAEADAHFKGEAGVRDYLVRRWESHAARDSHRILWDIAVFEAILRPGLATLEEIPREGPPLRVWTRIDVDGMKADFWEATKPTRR